MEHFFIITKIVIIKTFGWSGFDSTTDDMWNPIRELDIGKKNLEIQTNKGLSQADKKYLIAELNRQLDTLKR